MKNKVANVAKHLACKKAPKWSWVKKKIMTQVWAGGEKKNGK